MRIESDRVQGHLDKRGLYGHTIVLMSDADRDMRKALQGAVEGNWALKFSWELAQAVAQLVQVSELEFAAREQRLKLLAHIQGPLDRIPDRRARRRALKLLKRLERNVGVVAGRAVRAEVVFDRAVRPGS